MNLLKYPKLEKNTSYNAYDKNYPINRVTYNVFHQLMGHFLCYGDTDLYFIKGYVLYLFCYISILYIITIL